ncbi:hypothetical protein REPUB_Repub20aG0095900 [Reevesia pubescens]
MHGGKELPKVFTVFVNNLPQRANQRWLSTIFQKFGRVVDVFIPLKRSKWGKKIAFVRFGSLNDANRAILNLNGVFFLDHKIGVNMARFNPRKEFWRKRESFKGKGIVHEGDVASGNYEPGPARVKGIERDINQQKPECQKSYLQVLLDAEIGQAKKQEFGAEDDNQSLSSQKVVEEEQDADFCMGRIEEEKLHWLERSFIGRYNGALDLKNLAEEIKEEVSKSLTVRIFSGDEIIITFDNFEEFHRNRNNGWISFSKWLFYTRVWSEDPIRNRRNIWLACYGVPLHIWNLDTFQEIGSRWGDFIRLDNITMSPDSFTRGCMQITTSSFSRIDEVVKVKAGNFVYPVLVREVDLDCDFAGPCCYEHSEKALQGIQMLKGSAENGDHCSFSSSKLNGEDDKSLSIPKGGGSNGIIEAGKLNVAKSNYGEQDCEFMKMNKALHAANGDEAQSGSPGSNVPDSTEDDNEQLIDAVKSKEAMKNQKVHGTESQSLVDNDDEVEKAAEMENVAQDGRIEEHGQSGGHGPPSMGKELNVANSIEATGPGPAKRAEKKRRRIRMETREASLCQGSDFVVDAASAGISCGSELGIKDSDVEAEQTWGVSELLGIRFEEKKRAVSKVIAKWKPDIVFSQETKLRVVDLKVLCKLWSVSSCCFEHAESEGSAGGLITIWDREFFSWETKFFSSRAMVLVILCRSYS